jgi:hypothetical protein
MNVSVLSVLYDLMRRILQVSGQARNPDAGKNNPSWALSERHTLISGCALLCLSTQCVRSP